MKTPRPTDYGEPQVPAAPLRGHRGEADSRAARAVRGRGASGRTCQMSGSANRSTLGEDRFGNPAIGRGHEPTGTVTAALTAESTRVVKTIRPAWQPQSLPQP